MKLRGLLAIAFSLIAVGALSQCKVNTEDLVLYGLALEADNSLSPAVACASEVAVTTTQIDLVEDGDVTRSYSTTSPFYTDVDADGGTSWGFRSVETCVYPVNAFSGTVEIPISTNSTYAGRLDVKTSFPAAASGTWPGSNAALPTKLTFTGNGVTGHGTAARQCFTVTRINDGLLNAKESAYQINLDQISVGDSAGVYTGKNPCDVRVAMEDDEGPGVRVSSISRIMEEPGGTGFTTAQFFVRLRQLPTANVTIPINDVYDGSNAAHREGIASPTSLTFTTGNWNVDQGVTVTSQDDLEVDGTKTYIVQTQPATSTDTNYNGLDPRDVVVINNDKSVPGYTYTLFDATGGSTNAGSGATVNGFATDEMMNLGNTYSHFQLKLRSKPSSNVVLTFSTSNPAISTVQTTSLTFTPSNWNVDQTVNVIGKSDGVDGGAGNGNLDYTISFTAASSDTTYGNGGFPKPTFVMRSCDNDNTHLIQPCNFSGASYGDTRSRLSGGEPNATNPMWLVTKTVPGSTITVGLASTDTTEGTVPANVTIDSSNYASLGATANKIVLTHVDDTVLDGSQNWTVTTAAATGGSTYDTADILATTTDNEQRYYINVTGTTKEDDSKTATIDICLGATNTEAIQINAACSGVECGSVSPANVTFGIGQTISGGSPTNASCSSDANRRTFTIHGANDAFADGTQTFNITLTVSANTDPVYTGQNPGNPSISNEDDEMPGKAIYVVGAQLGEMTLAGVGGADNYCTTGKPAYAPSGTYKALIVSNGSPFRVATTTGTDSTGQVGWVLQPNYYYYRCSASGAATCSDQFSRLFIANSAGLIPFPMQTESAVNIDFTTTASDEFWTGMNGNMTPATQSSTPIQNIGDPAYRDNCAGWTYMNAPVNPFPTYYAETWKAGSTGNITTTTNVACTTTKKIICVQQ